MEAKHFKLIWLVVVVGMAGCGVPEEGGREKVADGQWQDTFAVDKADLSDTGRNDYFILEPGYTLSLEGKAEAVVITVLDETKVVDGVRTRVVEEREFEGGELAEVSRNYFAIDKTTGNVYYFGEDVDIYKDGKVVRHKGAWLSGREGARFGLMMPARPRAGDKFYQEVAPKSAMDRAEVLSVNAEVLTGAGRFENCVQFRETNPLEKGTDHKWFAPGVGMVKDGRLVLVKIGE